MQIKTVKLISLLSCILVCLSVFCVPFSAEVKTSTSGVHVEPQAGKDGKTYMVQVKDPGPQNTIDETKLTGTEDRVFNGEKIGTRNWYVIFEGYLSKVDTANKCLLIDFGGFTGKVQDLKDRGFKILNPAGAEIYYWDGGTNTLKIPYSDLSFVKEMYMVYGDQRVKITVA